MGIKHSRPSLNNDEENAFLASSSSPPSYGAVNSFSSVSALEHITVARGSAFPPHPPSFSTNPIILSTLQRKYLKELISQAKANLYQCHSNSGPLSLLSNSEEIMQTHSPCADFLSDWAVLCGIGNTGLLPSEFNNIALIQASHENQVSNISMQPHYQAVIAELIQAPELGEDTHVMHQRKSLVLKKIVRVALGYSFDTSIVYSQEDACALLNVIINIQSRCAHLDVDRMLAICLVESVEVLSSMPAIADSETAHDTTSPPVLTANDIALLAAESSPVFWQPYRCLFFCANGLDTVVLYPFMEALAEHMCTPVPCVPTLANPEVFTCFALLLTNNMPRLHDVLSRLEPSVFASLKAVLLRHNLIALTQVSSGGWNIVVESLYSLNPFWQLQPHMQAKISEGAFKLDLRETILDLPSVERSLLRSIFPVTSSIIDWKQAQLTQQAKHAKNRQILAQLLTAVGQKLLNSALYPIEIRACIDAIQALSLIHI